MSEERFSEIFNECKQKLEESGAHFLLLAGKDDAFGGRTICRAVGATRDELTALIIALVNDVPSIRGFFLPSFVEICRHAPESAGGDGDMKKIATALALRLKEMLLDKDMRDVPARESAK